MKKIPSVMSVMTPFPYSIGVDEPLKAAQKMMAEHGFHHLPVMEAGRLVGVLSDRLLRQSLMAPRASGREATVREADMLETYVVDLDQRLDNVVLEMAKRHIDSALIVKDGRLAGIFTATDACRCLGELLREDLPSGGDDAA